MKKAIILLTVFIAQFCYSQTHKYELSNKRNKLGTLTIVKTVVGEETHIDMTTIVNAKAIGKVNIDYKLKSVYKDGVLLNSEVITYVNKKLHTHATIEKNNSTYNITKDGHKSTWNEDITYTGAMLYIKEPKGINYVFSEDGTRKNLKKIDDKTYRIINPKKKKQPQEFTYQNGVLKSGIIHHPLMTFYLTKI